MEKVNKICAKLIRLQALTGANSPKIMFSPSSLSVEIHASQAS